MKIEPCGYGGMFITPENDCDSVWLEQFLSKIDIKTAKALDGKIAIDSSSGCQNMEEFKKDPGFVESIQINLGGL